jgi:hypothetical protein
MCQTALAFGTFVRYRWVIGGLRLRAGSEVGRGRTRIRVLIAIEEEYRSYREVIAACIRLLRPHVEVSSTATEGLERKAAILDPHLIISSRPKTAIPSPPIVWIMVPTEAPTRPTEIWLGEGPGGEVAPEADVVGLLAQVIDGIEETLAAAGDPNEILARPEWLGSSIPRPDRAVPDTQPDEGYLRQSSPHPFNLEGTSFGIP